MILRISKDYVVMNDLETTVISAYMLHISTTHMFIASNTWDKCIVEIDDSIPLNSLKFISGVCSDIQVILPEKINDHCMKLLTELFPKLSGTIRKNYLMGKSLGGVVPTCSL